MANRSNRRGPAQRRGSVEESPRSGSPTRSDSAPEFATRSRRKPELVMTTWILVAGLALAASGLSLRVRLWCAGAADSGRRDRPRTAVRGSAQRFSGGGCTARARARQRAYAARRSNGGRGPRLARPRRPSNAGRPAHRSRRDGGGAPGRAAVHAASSRDPGTALGPPDRPSARSSDGWSSRRRALVGAAFATRRVQRLRPLRRGLSAGRAGGSSTAPGRG